MTNIPKGFQGDEVIRVIKDTTTPTNYVPGRGADHVPSRIGTYELRVDDGTTETGDEVVLVVEGVSARARELISGKIADITEGQGVTSEYIIEVLRESEPRRVVIPSGNWTTHLADALEDAREGDVIVVHSDAMRSLAEAAAKRMEVDGLVTFEVEEPEIA